MAVDHGSWTRLEGSDNATSRYLLSGAGCIEVDHQRCLYAPVIGYRGSVIRASRTREDGRDRPEDRDRKPSGNIRPQRPVGLDGWRGSRPRSAGPHGA